MMVDSDIWKLALNAIDLPIFVVDAQLTVIYANPAVKSMTEKQGFIDNAAESEGKPLFELVPVLAESVGVKYKTLFETGSRRRMRSSILSAGVRAACSPAGIRSSAGAA